MTPILIDTVNHTQMRTHEGFNYVVISSVYDGGRSMALRFECNCSMFNTENEVKMFIELL